MAKTAVAKREAVNPVEAELQKEGMTLKGKIVSLQDEKGLIVVRDQMQADLAGNIVTYIGNLKKRVHDYLDGDISLANTLHKSLTGKRKKLLDPAESLEYQLKLAASVWIAAERKRAEEKQEQLAELAANVGLPPPVVDMPEIEGLTAKDGWGYHVENHSDFLAAAAKGKAPKEAFIVDDSWLKNDVKLNHARAVIDPETGKMYLYPGLHIFETVSMARKG